MIAMVVPHVGTWIEIGAWAYARIKGVVVPHVGTWIEIRSSGDDSGRSCRASRRHVD